VNDFPPGFSLRRATSADLVPFGEFSRRMFIVTYGPFHLPERMARHVEERLSDRQLKEELADPARTVLALTHGAEWAAYAQLRSADSPPAVAAARPVEIERFYVAHEWHGRGLAAPLMTAALDAAREKGHDAAWLAVWERNPRAVRFYEKQGFRVVGRHIYVFDGTPEDDHLMAVTL
jgi:GNAT superfamily N-acetyltransferase